MTRKSNFLLRIVFPLAGVASLLWFITRVIPKPSRAAYPCMRVAAPLASTFVVWLLGLSASLVFVKRARHYVVRSRHLAAVACVVAGGIVGGVLISSPNHPAVAATQATLPVGTAKGANPGRVVWVYDSSATNWQGLGDGHWWQPTHTIQTAVDGMMSRTLHSLSGKSDDASSWDTLFKYYNSSHNRGAIGYTAGEKIAIKVNFTFCNYLPAFCCVDSVTYSLNKKLDYMNTSPQMIRALLRQLVYVVGARQTDISVGDPTGYFPNEYHDSCFAEFPNVHYVDHAGKFGRTKVAFSSSPVYWSCRPAGVKQDYVAQHYADATYVINLANMKSHMGAGITLCAKNHYGSLIRLPTDSGYYDLHQSLAFMSPDTGSYRAVVDLMGHAHLGGKTVLYLIDGLYSGDHNNDTVPHKWNVAPFNGGWTSSLFASQDPVALESVLFDLFQLDEDPYQYPKIPGASDYLKEAALANSPPSGTFYDPNHATSTQRLQSLGVYEHWNNAADRKYSRNLGIGNGIELVFVNGASSVIRSVNRSGLNRTGYSIRALSESGTMELVIPASGDMALSVYDCRGRRAASLVDGFTAQGTYNIDVRKIAGLHSGTYVAVLYAKANGGLARVASSPISICGK